MELRQMETFKRIERIYVFVESHLERKELVSVYVIHKLSEWNLKWSSEKTLEIVKFLLILICECICKKKMWSHM